MKNLPMLAYVLVMVGALNWGLIGLTRMMGGMEVNLVSMVSAPLMIENLVYLLVGIAAAYLLVNKKKK